MGLIKAAVTAVTSTISDQWKDYFYCESLPNSTLAVKGRRKGGSKADNIISNGSVIAVADGQFMIIVDNGKIVDYCGEPGEYQFDASTEPSLFAGSLGDAISQTFANIGKRFTFGGVAAADQRVYYFNTKEIMNNKYGTPSPVPFRVVDERFGLDVDVNIRCFGEYSYRISDPLLFYTNVCGNVTNDFEKEAIENQLKTELYTALQPAFAKISAKQIRYNELPAHTMEIADALNEVLSTKWRDIRGIEIVSLGISSAKMSEEDEAAIKEIQMTAAYKDSQLRDALLAKSKAKSMVDAANNTAGTILGVANMNAINAVGGNFENPGTPAGGWTCPKCGTVSTGNFCTNCGTAKPAPAAGWTCPKCGATNTGNFCTSCGTAKPVAGVCPHCGQPVEGSKFCPHCGKQLY